MALRTTCNKNVKFKILKTRTGCQYIGYVSYSENLNWGAQNLRLGRGLDIAGFGAFITGSCVKWTHMIPYEILVETYDKQQSMLNINTLP